MSFPTSSLSTNTAPLPTAPPRPVRNSRGLRADTAAPLFKTNVFTHHGQVTLLPPPNMVRVRASRQDGIPSSSASSAVDVTDETASSIRPRRRNNRTPRPSAAPDGREEIVLRPGQTASDAIKEQYRRSEASMRQPPPAPRPPPSSPSAQQVRRARQRVGVAGLTRGASMMRRNVQEDIVAPAPAEDDSDITPSIPPPTYPHSISSAAIRPPAQPPAPSDPSDPSPAYPTLPTREQPPSTTSRPAASSTEPTEDVPAVPSSPPPSYALPVVEQDAAPSVSVLAPVAVAAEVAPAGSEPTPVVLEPLSLTRRIWDEMVREQIPFEERIKRMRAWEGAGPAEDEDDEGVENAASQIVTLPQNSPPHTSSPQRSSQASPTPPSPPPKEGPASPVRPQSQARPRIQPLATLPSFRWESEPILSFTLPSLTTVEEHPTTPPEPLPSSPPPLPTSPRPPVFSSKHDHLAPLLSARAASSPSVPALIVADAEADPVSQPTPIETQRSSVPDAGRLSEPAGGEDTIASRPSSTEPPPLPPRPPANPPPAILLRLSRRRRPPPPPPSANRTSSPVPSIRRPSAPPAPPPPPPPPPPLAPVLAPPPEPAPPRKQPPPPPPSLSARKSSATIPRPSAAARPLSPKRPTPSPRPTPPPPPPSLSARPPLAGHAGSSSRLLGPSRRVSEVSVATSSIFETPEASVRGGLPRRTSAAGELAALTRSSWSAQEPAEEVAPTVVARPTSAGGGALAAGRDGRPAWATRPLPRPPGTNGSRTTPTTTAATAETSASGVNGAAPTVQLDEQQPFEITDLDLLVSRLDQSTHQFEAAQTLQTFLSPSVPAHLSPRELALLPTHQIVELSRRTTKAGKVKIKLAWGSSTDHPEEGTVRVDRCSFGCMCLFKAGERALGLKPGCGHVGHEECARRWFEGSRRCPVCRAEVEVGELI